MMRFFSFSHKAKGERDLVLLRHQIGIEWPSGKKVKRTHQMNVFIYNLKFYFCKTNRK